MASLSHSLLGSWACPLGCRVSAGAAPLWGERCDAGAPVAVLRAYLSSMSMAKVVLNVYDINAENAERQLVSAANDLTINLGIGVFHSGLEVHGVEWAFGSTATGPGIQASSPRRCAPHQYKFRTSVEIGETPMSAFQVRRVIKAMGQMDLYQGSSYHLFHNNCNHFSDHLSRLLTQKPIPLWVNRGARTLKNISDGAERVAKHPVTQRMGRVVGTAGRTIREGVVLGVGALKRGINASQAGFMKLYSELSGACMGFDRGDGTGDGKGNGEGGAAASVRPGLGRELKTMRPAADSKASSFQTTRRGSSAPVAPALRVSSNRLGGRNIHYKQPDR